MTPLRHKMEADLRLRNLAKCTMDAYIRCVAAFALFFGRSPARLGASQVRAFLLHLAELGRAPATRVVYHPSLTSRRCSRHSLSPMMPMGTACSLPPGPETPSIPDLRRRLRARTRVS